DGDPPSTSLPGLYGGGGGGGGWYGGGGGSEESAYTTIDPTFAGGGGGGSSHGPAGSVYSVHMNTQDPATVIISYAAQAPDTTAPTIAINTPKDGATYAQGQRVLAAYSCSDEQGGSGIDSCIGDADLHGPVDTATNGSHSFTVTATDAAGNRATKTVHYTVGHPRADLVVAIGSSAASIQPGGVVTQTVRVTNAGPPPPRSIATVVMVPR